ncbi:MAG: enoyl-CoA hydratase/isomerase family protein, partial [Bdellovibrionales bacterium]|nr:enoyl-CoA hydratase/isomerase family protein [Bdellovibrionales bacterium]
FPDVGVSHTLSRLPEEIGLYLALTGCRINYREAHTLGMANFYFENTEKEKVFHTLISSSFKNKDEVNLLLKNIQSRTTSPDQENWIQKQKSQIASLFESKKLKDIYKKFYDSPTAEDKKWAKNRKTFLQGSPTSAGIIYELLKRAKSSTLKEVFQTDLVLALNCSRGPDFSEGVRALSVEKHGKPIWKPNSIEQVTEENIQKYFQYDPPWV